MFRVCVTYLFISCNIALSKDAPLQIDIMGGNIRAMPIAISYFSFDKDIQGTNLQNDMPNLIASNLVNSGLFKLLDSLYKILEMFILFFFFTQFYKIFK